MLKLQPYAQSSLVNRPFPKHAYKYFGPYSVVERIGMTAYKHDLPANSHVHPVFHVSQLKQFTPHFALVFSNQTHVKDLAEHELALESILERRLIKMGNVVAPQTQVNWVYLPEESATWEDWYVLINRFPSLATWEQASSLGDRGVMLATTSVVATE